MRRLLIAVICVAVGPWPGVKAAQESGADAAPVLPQPGYRPNSGAPFDLPALPAQEEAGPIHPPAPPSAIELYVRRARDALAPLEYPRTVYPEIEFYERGTGDALAPLEYPHTEYPEITDGVMAQADPCLAAAWSAPTGYPSCGGPTYGNRCCYARSWFIDAEVSWLAVLADSGGSAQATFDDSTFAGAEATLERGQGLDSYGVAPRVALGYQHSLEWGMVGRYWSLSDASSGSPRSIPPVAALQELITGEESRVELAAADLEAVRTFAPGRWQLDAALGARFASLGISTRMEGSADFADDSLAVTRLFNNTSFDGAGLTGALTLRRPIAATRSSAFFSGRGSTLWGSASSRSQAETTLITPSGAAFGRFGRERQADHEFAFVGELQAGLEWTAMPGESPVAPFFRLAGECQWWTVDAPLSSSATVDVPGGSINVLSASSAGAGEVELYGVTLAVGFIW